MERSESAAYIVALAETGIEEEIYSFLPELVDAGPCALGSSTPQEEGSGKYVPPPILRRPRVSDHVVETALQAALHS